MNSRHVSCNLCKQDDYRVIQLDEPFKLVKCKRCGLVYVDPQPEEGALFAHYNEEYFREWLREKTEKMREKVLETAENAG